MALCSLAFTPEYHTTGTKMPTMAMSATTVPARFQRCKRGKRGSSFRMRMSELNSIM